MSKDNNPSPLDNLHLAIGSLGTMNTFSLYKNSEGKNINIQNEFPEEYTSVLSALTDYNKQTEMLEGIKNRLMAEYGRLNSHSYVINQDLYLENFEEIIADITKVLEGKNDL
jgi:hypothetical protein